MYTPETTRQRKELRNIINKEFPGVKPCALFEKFKMPKAPVISFRTISQWSDKLEINPDNLSNIFAPYGVSEPYLSSQQWEKFLNDDFANYENDVKFGESLTEKQNFILIKFMGVLRTKFGASMISRWNSALTRNPPSAPNTSLRVSALCRIYRDTNLPFDASEFVDAIFAFYNEKMESITFDQFSQLFTAYP